MVGIAVRDVSKSFLLEDQTELEVISGVTIDIADREFFTLVGPSGCGKSTLLNILAGLIDTDQGEISLQADDDSGKRIGFVFQDPTLLDWKTVAQNIEFALESMGVPEEEHEGRVDDVLDRVNLLEFKNEYPQALSGGMRQRVGLARALSIHPDVLMMDEPFSSLDEITARRLRQDLLEIWGNERTTVIFVTHDIQEAVFLSDRIGILSDKPARLARILDIDIERPRDLDDPAILEYEKEVLRVLGIED